MAITKTTHVEPTDREYYDMMLIEENRHVLMLEQFANQKSIPKRNGKTINFRKRTPFPTVTTPMAEGVTPPARGMVITEQTASVYQFGDVAGITDWVDGTSTDPVLNEITDEQSIQMKETREEYIRDQLFSLVTTNKRFLSAAGGILAANVAACDQIITTAALDSMILLLKNGKAKYLTEIVNPGTGYNSTSIGASYVAIAHTNVVADLVSLDNWKDVEDYAEPGARMENEVGKYRNIRFLESTHGHFQDDATDETVDAFSTFFFAKDGWSVVGLDGQSTGTYHTPFGAGDDHLEQRAYAGWKMALGLAVTNQANIACLVHTATNN
jgi:N4-gp56 family major capsid protein